jgi:hypothetical protein
MLKLNPKIRAIVAIILIAVIFVILIIATYNKNNSKQPSLDSGKYVDPNSGETISNPKGKGPDTYGSASNEPIYLGTTELINRGVTTDDLNKLKAAFYDYSAKNNKNIREVSINIASIQTPARDPNTTDPSIITFNVVFDRKDTYRARFQYTGLGDVRLILYNSKTNAQVYDSGTFGGYDSGE